MLRTILFINLIISIFWIKLVVCKVHNDEDTPQLIQISAGREVKLKCGIRNNHAEYLTSSDVRWFFKRCGEGYNKTSCKDHSALNQIPQTMITNPDDGKPFKKLTLTIKNATELESGFYKCSVHPYRTNNETTLLIQVSRTYQLEIIDSKMAAFEFVGDLPTNITALLNTQVVLQCRVYSKYPPQIKWIKSTEAFPSFSMESMRSKLFGDAFELMNSADKKELSEEDTYLSKVILNNVAEKDIGLYICVAINSRGFKTREIYLNVVPEIIQDLETNAEKTGSGQFLLLFLIPVIFALIPIGIWGCYLICRLKRKNRKNNDLFANASVSNRNLNGNYRKNTRYMEIHRNNCIL